MTPCCWPWGRGSTAGWVKAPSPRRFDCWWVRGHMFHSYLCLGFTCQYLCDRLEIMPVARVAINSGIIGWWDSLDIGRHSVSDRARAICLLCWME